MTWARTSWSHFEGLTVTYGDALWWAWTRRSFRRRLLGGRPRLVPLWAVVVQWAADWRVGVVVTTSALVLVALSLAAAFPKVDLPFGQALTDLWQVQAAVLGFAVALAVYAMGLLGRYSSMARSMPLVASFPAVVNAGLALLLATGTAVALTDEPLRAWMALVLLVASAGWLVLVANALAHSVRLHDPTERVLLRRWTIRRIVARAVQRLALATYGMQWLEKHVAAAGGRYEALGVGSIPEDSNRVLRCGRDGEIQDLNLYRLLWATTRSAEQGVGLEIGFRPSQRVGVSSVLAVSDLQASPEVQRALHRAVRVGRAPAESLADEIDLLRREATSAIDSDVSVLEAVLEVFTEAIEEWAIYEQSFAGADIE